MDATVNKIEAGTTTLTAFLKDLTAICTKHGIGITGTPVLFLMDQEDYQHIYAADQESRLYRA